MAGKANPGDHLVRGLRDGDSEGARAVGSQGVTLIGSQLLRPGQQPVRRQDRGQTLEDVAGAAGEGLAQDFAQGGQHEVHVADSGAMAHQADAPGFAGHGTKPGADLDAILLEQAAPDASIVGPGRDMDAIERVQSIFGVRSGPGLRGLCGAGGAFAHGERCGCRGPPR